MGCSRRRAYYGLETLLYWAIDGNNIFTEGAYITDGANFEDLVADAKIVLELEDDTDEDYYVNVLECHIGE